MSTVIRGQQGMVLRAINRRKTPGTGWASVYVYETGDKALAEQFASSQDNGANGLDLDLIGPPYRVEVSTPDAGEGTQDESYEDVWELPGVNDHKSIFESPVFESFTDEVKDVFYEFKNGITATDALNRLTTDLGLSTSSTPYILLTQYIKGLEEFIPKGGSLQWTRIIGRNAAAVSGAASDEGKIFSLNTITGLQGMPANVIQYVTIKHNSMPTPGTGYATGWLKFPTNFTQRGTNKAEVTQTWVLGNWSTTLYGNPV